MSSPDFDQKTQEELKKFLDAENAKAQMQSTIHEFTGRCWDKCIKSATSNNNKIDSTEKACLENCVNRFVDTSMFIVKRLQNRN
ncbi:Mitochondrial import inner membrane translocase subunit tim8 [Mycoemilia scoparia]|uniref:Mitochondrial import inner membrane translocase subunit n=1 Tax=Mycoemilia scoparia TaxID=417184 RepID=A0A9W8DRK2_9FUNG|nr:Mitochondrial import inner membrane translocase subunit tim8 [Mycoemilia scoparia]